MKVDLSTYIEKNIIQTQILYKFMSYKLMCYIYYCYGILRNNITMLQRFVKSLKLYAILNIVINLPSRENKKKKKKIEAYISKALESIMQHINIVLNCGISICLIKLDSSSLNVPSCKPEKPASADYRHLPNRQKNLIPP